MSTPNEYDEDADFEAGFASTEPEPSGDTLALDDTPQPQPGPAEPKPVEAAAVPTNPTPEAAPVDPFADLPPAVRDLLGKVPALESELQSLRRAAGMVPVLQSKLDRLERDRAPAPPPQEATPAPTPRPKLEKLRADGLDDIADAVEEIAATIAPRATPAPAAPEPAPTPAAPAAPQPQADPVLALLDDMRPTWAKDLDSTDFKLWLSQQPDTFQQEVRTTNSAKRMLDALGDFDRFQAQKTATPPPPPPAQPSRQLQRMTAAMAPRGDGRANRAPAPIDDEDAAFEAGFHGR